MHLLTEKITASEAHKGDIKLFTDLYNRYQGPLFWFAFNILKNEADAEDVVADAFIKLWNSGKYTADQHMNIRAYMHLMIRNACIDLFRRARLKSKLEAEFLQEMETEAEDIFYQSQIKAEVLQTVQEQINRLSPKYRTVFNLSLRGMKNEEIASELQISNQVVRDIKCRIRKVLRGNMLGPTLFFTIVFHWIKTH